MTQQDRDQWDYEREAQIASCGLEDDEREEFGWVMPCFECAGASRAVTSYGPVVNPADPTQSYWLECGHLAI